MDKVMDDIDMHIRCSNASPAFSDTVSEGVVSSGKVEEFSPGLVAGGIAEAEGMGAPTAERIDISGIPSKDELMRKRIGLKTPYYRLRTVFGRDDRMRVEDTACWPWSAICSLLLKWGKKEYIGTGCLIGPDTVLTCGHNLFDKADGGWASEITVMPGRNGDDLPFGYSGTDQIFSVEGWVQNADPICDYGCIKLSQPLEKDPGWIGYGIFSDADIKNCDEMKVSGYPADKKALPGSMWYAVGRIGKITPGRICYKLDTNKGESGSPVWMNWRDDKPYIVGIHNYGGDFSNKATRISKSVYENLLSWANM